MKKALLVVLAVAFVVFAAGSSNAQGKIKFGIGAEVAIPMTSPFKDTQNIGIGGTARGYYMLNDMATLTATAGYMTFGGKDFTPAGAPAGTSIKAGSWSQIPVLVGGRYYFSPASSSFRLYGAFEMGLLFGSYTIPEVKVGNIVVFPSQTVSGSDFSYQPQLGFEASNFDVAVRYLGVSGAASVAARIGYIFN